MIARTLAALIFAAMVAKFAGAQEADTVNRTDWFRDAKWGVFVHYLSDTVLRDQELTPETWNAAVDSFDVDAFANTMEQVGAGYCIVTLGQNSGYYCSPNATYDRYVGYEPSRCSKRDLIADLAAALKTKGIRLLTYLPSGAPDRDEQAMKALEWQKGDHRLASFQRMWEDVIREWAVRWGDSVAGWWFDGCYYAEAMYRSPEPPNFESFAAAARAGNPQSIVAFNPGVKYPVIRHSAAEDYVAGEINEPEKAECAGRWVDGAQGHMLSYLGPTWGQGPPRFTDEQAIAFTRKFTGCDWAVSWDVPLNATGAIPEPFVAQLQAIGAAVRSAH